MAYQYFENKEQSELYHKYMIREPTEVHKLVLSYLEEKKGKSCDLAVDVGCGTGQSTRILAPHLKKVVGVDNNENQLQEARSVKTPPNVSYVLATAEKLPFEDSSVDLITASVSAHWFNIEKFLQEVDRVLKPRGCLAMYCLNLHCDLFYNNCSKLLTEVFSEDTEFLINEFGNERVQMVGSEYKYILDAVPFPDKKRVTKILMKSRITVASLMGFVESLCLFQTFILKDQEGAEKFLQKMQKRIMEAMETSSTDTELEITNNYFCVLACKPVRKIDRSEIVITDSLGTRITL